MSWVVVADKEVREVARTRLLQVLSAVVAVGIVAAAAVTAVLAPEAGFADSLVRLGSAVRLLVPALALLAGFDAVVGERESGTLKFLLALPHSRRDVVLGKVLGRSAAVVIPALVGLVVAGGVAIASYPAVPFATYAAFAGLSTLYGLAFASLVLAVSTAAGSTVRSLSVSTAAVVGSLFLWGPALDELGGLVPGGQLAPALGLLQQLAPSGAYATLVSSLAASEPASPWSVALLCLWAVVPLAAGYYRFRAVELA